jgi:hypothetical protein
VESWLEPLEELLSLHGMSHCHKVWFNALPYFFFLKKIPGFFETCAQLLSDFATASKGAAAIRPATRVIGRYATIMGAVGLIYSG